ncbi:early nodulin-93-like [Nymphaea colorata]|nr:early nodulin-93-like [Nymphaea colorata]
MGSSDSSSSKPVNSNAVSSPLEMNQDSGQYLNQKLVDAKRYGHEGVVAGAKAALVGTIASAVPTFVSVRVFPWARYNLNPAAQALIVSTVAGAAYFIVADKTVLASARKNSVKRVQE